MLLIGFYVLGVGLLVVVVGLDALMLYGNALVLLLFGLPLSGAAFIVVVRAFYASLLLGSGKVSGVSVLESEHSDLWAAVRAAADAAGTAAPTFLWIDSRFNAAVFERTRWLGLRSGQRHLIIGAPMLVALSPTKLDAVLAHEFGHFAGRDTRLLPVVMRGRAGLASALDTAAGFAADAKSGGWMLRGQPLIYALVRAYAVRFLTATQKVSRAQEYAADRISAELCGRDVAADTLAEMSAYRAAYRHFRTWFADAGTGFGLVPHPNTLFAGFGSMLDESNWRDVVESERDAPSPKKSSAFDSHPPIAERVAALRALPDDGRTQDTSRGRAVDSFAGTYDLLEAVAGLEPQHLEKRRVDWDVLADTVARAHARKAAQPLVDALHLIKGAPPVLADFFDQIEAGQMELVHYRLLTPAQLRYASTGTTVVHEIGARALASTLPAWVMVELADAGLVRWTHSWSKVAVLKVDGAPADIDKALAALLAAAPSAAAPAAGRLREILRGTRIAV